MNSKLPSMLARLIAVFAILPLYAPCRADDSARAKSELSRWIMNYYAHPDPEHFVERVKALSAAEMLHDPSPGATPDACVMFLGKVMAQNPGKIREWMDALASLPEAEQRVLHKAVWYSGTAEGKTWLEEHGESAMANGPRPMLLSDQKVTQLQPYHLDQLWEWFFATGEEAPVARITSLFSLAHQPPQPNSLELLPPPVRPTAPPAPAPDQGPTKPGSNSKFDSEMLYRLRMSNYRLLQPAMWSCSALAAQDDRVREILRKIETEHYHPGIKAWVGQILKVADSKRAQQGKK